MAITKKLLRVESGERIDEPDFTHISRQNLEFFESVVGTLHGSASVVAGFTCASAGAAPDTVVRVSRTSTGAIIIPEQGHAGGLHSAGDVCNSYLLDTDSGGSNSVDLDLAGQPNTDHHIYVQFSQFAAIDQDPRVFWNATTQQEFTKSAPAPNTRFAATWSLLSREYTVAAPANSVRVGTVRLAGGVISQIFQTQQRLYEGCAASPLGSAITTTAPSSLVSPTFLPDFSRSDDRSANGSTNFAQFANAALKSIEEIKSGYHGKWYRKPPQGLSLDAAQTVTVTVGTPEHPGNFTATTQDGSGYWIIDTALSSALAAATSLHASAPVHVHIKAGKYIMGAVTTFQARDLTLSGSGDATVIRWTNNLGGLSLWGGGHRNILIQDLLFEATATNRVFNNTGPIRVGLDDSNRITLDNVNLKDGYVAASDDYSAANWTHGTLMTIVDTTDGSTVTSSTDGGGYVVVRDCRIEGAIQSQTAVSGLVREVLVYGSEIASLTVYSDATLTRGATVGIESSIIRSFIIAQATEIFCIGSDIGRIYALTEGSVRLHGCTLKGKSFATEPFANYPRVTVDLSASAAQAVESIIEVEGCWFDTWDANTTAAITGLSIHTDYAAACDSATISNTLWMPSTSFFTTQNTASWCIEGGQFESTDYAGQTRGVRDHFKLSGCQFIDAAHNGVAWDGPIENCTFSSEVGRGNVTTTPAHILGTAQRMQGVIIDLSAYLKGCVVNLTANCTHIWRPRAAALTVGVRYAVQSEMHDCTINLAASTASTNSGSSLTVDRNAIARGSDYGNSGVLISGCTFIGGSHASGNLALGLALGVGNFTCKNSDFIGSLNVSIGKWGYTTPKEISNQQILIDGCSLYGGIAIGHVASATNPLSTSAPVADSAAITTGTSVKISGTKIFRALEIYAPTSSVDISDCSIGEQLVAFMTGTQSNTNDSRITVTGCNLYRVPASALKGQHNAALSSKAVSNTKLHDDALITNPSAVGLAAAVRIYIDGDKGTHGGWEHIELSDNNISLDQRAIQVGGKSQTPEFIHLGGNHCDVKNNTIAWYAKDGGESAIQYRGYEARFEGNVIDLRSDDTSDSIPNLIKVMDPNGLFDTYPTRTVTTSLFAIHFEHNKIRCTTTCGLIGDTAANAVVYADWSAKANNGGGSPVYLSIQHNQIFGARFPAAAAPQLGYVQATVGVGKIANLTLHRIAGFDFGKASGAQLLVSDVETTVNQATATWHVGHDHSPGGTADANVILLK